MTRASHHEQIGRALGADLDAFARLLSDPTGSITGPTRPAQHLLMAAAVRTVLAALQRHAVSPDLVQRWASFMRRGYIAGANDGPIVPLDIQYERSKESAIVEVLARLDEIGDAVDGELAPNELPHLLRLLA